MSADMDARHLLWRFTETQVAALTVAAIFQSGAVGRDPATLAAMCRAAGVTVSDVRRSVEAVERGRWTGPTDLPTQPPPEASDTPPDAPVAAARPAPSRVPLERPGPPCSKCGQPTFRRGLHGRFPKLCPACRTAAERPSTPRDRPAWNRLPDGTTRVCGSCGESKAIDAFAVRSDTGTRRGVCDRCRLANKRNRYATAERALVTLELLASDPAVGHACPVCHGALAVGDIVEVRGTARHADCQCP